MTKNENKYCTPPMKKINFHYFELRKIHFYFTVILRTPLLKYTLVTAKNENNQPFFNS